MTTHAHRAHDRHEPEGVGSMSEQADEFQRHKNDPCSIEPTLEWVRREQGAGRLGPVHPELLRTPPTVTADPRATAREDGGEGRG